MGGTSLIYTPPSLTGVKDKDTIIFIFLQKNHTVTQSSFLNPCQKVTNAFASGFMPSNGSALPFVLAEFSDPMSTGTPLCKQFLELKSEASADPLSQGSTAANLTTASWACALASMLIPPKIRHGDSSTQRTRHLPRPRRRHQVLSQELAR